MSAQVATSTRPEDQPIERLRRMRRLRRIGLAAIGLLLVAGMLNLLGVRTGVARDASGGVTLAVTYAQVSRSGLATPWLVAVSSPDGFDGPVTVTTSAEYFDRFDFNEFYPEPSSTTMQDDLLVLTFDQPDGDRLVVRFDGRASPTFGLGSEATTTLETDGLPRLSVTYRTVVMP